MCKLPNLAKDRRMDGGVVGEGYNLYHLDTFKYIYILLSVYLKG